MSKVQINTFTMTDKFNWSLEAVKAEALVAAKRREEWDYSDEVYENITVEVEGPITKTEVYYDVKVYGEKICVHPKEKIRRFPVESINGILQSTYRCDCGKIMEPVTFKEAADG